MTILLIILYTYIAFLILKEVFEYFSKKAEIKRDKIMLEEMEKHFALKARYKNIFPENFIFYLIYSLAGLINNNVRRITYTINHQERIFQFYYYFDRPLTEEDYAIVSQAYDEIFDTRLWWYFDREELNFESFYVPMSEERFFDNLANTQHFIYSRAECRKHQCVLPCMECDKNYMTPTAEKIISYAMPGEELSLSFVKKEEFFRLPQWLLYFVNLALLDEIYSNIVFIFCSYNQKDKILLTFIVDREVNKFDYKMLNRVAAKLNSQLLEANLIFKTQIFMQANYLDMTKVCDHKILYGNENERINVKYAGDMLFMREFFCQDSQCSFCSKKT